MLSGQEQPGLFQVLTETADETPPGADVTDEEIEELLGLDEEDYTEIEEDDFDASIEVRYEQSVPFPTDI